MNYIDFTFQPGTYRKMINTSDTTAVLCAIKDIILARPGNYVMDPDVGVNIAKYQFELLDDITISNIKSDITKQISKALPTLDNIEITINKVEDYINGEPVTMLGIYVEAMVNGKTSDESLLVMKEGEILSVYDEIRWGKLWKKKRTTVYKM